MNTEKTKIIWIGRNFFSKDKITAKYRLEWGTTRFKLLGIDFSVELKDMIEINFNQAFNKIQKMITPWKKRMLTPLGKITVIKTFLLSKLNHLFTSLPNPTLSFIEKLNKTFYDFIWDNKPVKVKRSILIQDYLDGGLKMLNTDWYIQSLKTTWIRRLLKNHIAVWTQMFDNVI